LRLQATCYRAHDPKWSFDPVSGNGAAIYGARFNPKGTPALYLALTMETAIKEVSQGLGYRINPCVLCRYDVDCADVVDLRTDAGRAEYDVAPAELSGAWKSDVLEAREPATWQLARRLIAGGFAGILVPSFAAGATRSDQNLVLWDWSERPPHQVRVFDPSGRLPRNQLSWE
jgi:RES domain-containing protein